MGSICTSCCSHFNKNQKQIQKKTNNSLFLNSDDENSSAMLIAKQQNIIHHQEPMPKTSSNYGSIINKIQKNTQINISNIYNIIKEDPQPIIIQNEKQNQEIKSNSNSNEKDNNLSIKECEQSLIANEQNIEYEMHENFETKSSSEQKSLEDDHQKKMEEKQQTTNVKEEQKEASASSTIVSTVAIVSEAVSETSDLISVQTQNVIIDKCGNTALNGEYRYFSATQSWCNFEESASFSLVSNFRVDRIYDQINDDFRWADDILRCWIICDMDEKLIYYASPKTNDDFIPNEGWVCVHGSLPLPCLQINIGHETREPMKNEVFGNLSVVDEGTIGAKDIFVDDDDDYVEDDDGKEVEEVVDDDVILVEDENQEIEEIDANVEEEYEEDDDYDEDEGSSVSDL